MPISHIRLVDVINEAAKMPLILILLLMRQLPQGLLIGPQLIWIQLDVHVQVPRQGAVLPFIILLGFGLLPIGCRILRLLRE